MHGTAIHTGITASVLGISRSDDIFTLLTKFQKNEFSE